MPYELDDSSALQPFAMLANEYCRVIEQHGTLGRSALLHRVHRLLPQLYAAGLALPSTDVLFADDLDEAEASGPSEDDDEWMDSAPLPEWTPDPDALTLEAWRELHRSLSVTIGERNFYRELFDPYEPADEKEVMGSLADDLADVYRDLSRGLRKWERGESGGALWEWRFNLESHWGQHATDALRALYWLASSYDLGWPPPATDVT